MEPSARRPRGGRAYHSQLEPHLELIREWRRERRTWREIADQLETQHGVKVTLQAVYLFMRRRMRRMKHGSWEESSNPPSPVVVPSPPLAVPPKPPTGGFRKPSRSSYNPDEYL